MTQKMEEDALGRRVSFCETVLVYDARPRDVFCRPMSYQNDFRFNEPERSILMRQNNTSTKEYETEKGMEISVVSEPCTYGEKVVHTKKLVAKRKESAGIFMLIVAIVGWLIFGIVHGCELPIVRIGASPSALVLCTIDGLDWINSFVRGNLLVMLALSMSVALIYL